MKKAAWKRRIVEACELAGTYRDYFVPVIDTLASILEKRDDAQDAFEKSGSVALIKHTNKAGASTYEQNPLIRLVNDLNRDALAYWRDLGLTPAGLKRINEDSLKPKKTNLLADVLADLSGD